MCIVLSMLARVSEAEVVTCSAAVVSSGSLVTAGSSRTDVYWGRVIARGDIRFLDLDVTVDALPSAHIDVDPRFKTFGAGIDYPVGEFSGKELWLRWQCTGQFVRSAGGESVFPSSINGVGVTDLFCQVMNGAFSGYDGSNVYLLGRYVPLTVPLGEGILFDAPTEGIYPMGTGAFVQNWPDVGSQVDSMLAHFDYDQWKQTAIDRGYYVRPNGVTPTSFADADGNLLYVQEATAGSQAFLTTSSLGNTPLAKLGQITMRPLVPPEGNTSLVPDRVLFVDTVEGTADGTRATISLSPPDPFFWKGVAYMMCDLETASGGNGASVLAKTPYEYMVDPTGSSTGTVLPDCIVDGILFHSGDFQRNGVGSVYGSYITTKGNATAGPPPVYYNSRLTTEGIIVPHFGPFVSAQSGNWWDRNTWGGIGVPDAGSSVSISEGHSVEFSGSIVDIKSLSNNGQLTCAGQFRFTNGSFANYGQVLIPSSLQMQFTGPGSFVNHNSIAGQIEQLSIQNESSAAAFTIDGGVDVGQLLLHNTHLELVAPVIDSPVVRAFDSATLRGDSTAGGTGLITCAGTLAYSNGAFSTGREWIPEAEFSAISPHDILVEPNATLTINAGPGQIYWTENVVVSSGGTLVGPGVGELRVGTSIVNNGSMFIDGNILNAMGAGPAALTHGTASSITTTQTLSGTGPVTFPYCDVDMNFASLGMASSVEVTRHQASHPNAPPAIAATGVTWELSAKGAGFSTSLRMVHSGLTDPYLCRYTGSGTSWVPARSRFDAATVELDGVTQFSTWAVGDASAGPVPVSVSDWSVE